MNQVTYLVLIRRMQRWFGCVFNLSSSTASSRFCLPPHPFKSSQFVSAPLCKCCCPILTPLTTSQLLFLTEILDWPAYFSVTSVFIFTIPLVQ